MKFLFLILSFSGLFCIGLLKTNAQNVNPKEFLTNVSDTSIQLKPIQVDAYQNSQYLRTLPGSLSVLTSENITLNDGVNFAGSLNTLPGVSIQNGTFLTNRIVIRGMGSRTPYNTNRIKVYLNHIPLTSSDGVSSPEEIELQGFGRIEIIKGAASALYGSGLGGSINMFTPVIKAGNITSNLQYGSFNTFMGSVSGALSGKKLNLWGSMSHFQSDGFRENNFYNRNSFLSTAGWKEKRWSLNLLLLAIDVKGGIPSSIGETLFNSNPKAAAPNWKAIGGFKEYSKGVTGITLQNNLSENLINLFTFFGRLNQNFEKRPFNNLTDESASFGFRNKLTFHHQKTDWILGLERITDLYRWELTKNENLINKNKEDREHLTAFILLYYRPVSSLNISLGGSFNSTKYQLTDLFPSDGNSSGKRDFPSTFSPRIGINYAPNPIISFYASAGHGFSLPSPEETLQPEGNINPEIKPETGIQYELGARFFFREKRFELDGTLYQIDLQNLLVTKRLTEDQFTGINAGKTNHKGIELTMKKELFNFIKFPGNLTTGLSYFRSVNRFIDFNDNGNTYNGNLLPGIPKQTLVIQLKWVMLRNTEITSDFNYTGNQFMDDSNNLTYPGYYISNFKIKTSFNLNKQIKIVVYGGIKNLTDTNYASMLIVNALSLGNNEPRFYYPGQPRNFYSGIQFSF